MSIDHHQLLDLLGQKYPANKKGMCYGIAVMGMLALLAGDLATFKKRLVKIHSIIETKKLSAEDFENFIQEIKNTRVNTIQKYREKLLKNLHKDEKMNDTDFYELLKQEENNTFVKEFLDKRLHVDNELSQEQRDLADVDAFFEILSLHFSPYQYSFLYPEHATLLEQNAALTFSFGLPDKLVKNVVAANDNSISDEKRKPEIVEVPLVKKTTSFVGMYDLESLTEYFKEMRLILAKFTPPVTFLLTNYDHSITIAYDVANKQWQMIESGDISYIECPADIDIANQVLMSFSENDFTTFKSEIFCHTDQADEVGLLISKLIDSEEWKRIHSVQGKQVLLDSNKASLMYMALVSGKIDTVQDLLELKDPKINPNSALLPKQETPLFIAARHGHLNIVRMLLDLGVDNEQLSNGMTPLGIAAMRGNLDVVKTLFSSGVEIDKVMPMGGTALLAAASYGRLEVVKYLLAHGADALLTPLGGVRSPLYAAAQAGQVEVVKVLLESIKDNPALASNVLYKASLLEDEKAVNTLLACGVSPSKEHLSFFSSKQNDESSQVTFHVDSTKRNDNK